MLLRTEYRRGRYQGPSEAVNVKNKTVDGVKLGAFQGSTQILRGRLTVISPRSSGWWLYGKTCGLKT